MIKSDKIDMLSAALCKAQAEIKNAKKDSENPFFHSAYSDLASVREAIQEAFTKHGLSYTQVFDRDDHGVVVETVLMHGDQYIGGRLSLKPVKDDPQGIGSALTYARRYSLQAIAGIAADDDDAEGAQGRGEKTEPKKESNKQAEKPATKPAKTEAPLSEKSITSSDKKPGDAFEFEGTVVKTWLPDGKKMHRVEFADDKTTYCSFHHFTDVKAQDLIAVKGVAKESDTGAVYYEITEYKPII
jgi:hypothetical protein